MEFVAQPGLTIQLGSVTYRLAADPGNPTGFADLHIASPYGDGSGQMIQLSADDVGRASVRITIPPAGHPTEGGLGVTVFEGTTQVYPPI